ncbi:hypothetical protein GCM10010919_26670 [Alishewanella longhuensis]|uniref:Uncharacterized protein n=1 Tax=Alishewanella longhuensis TaxID=1091037 RepID=A0ABQ3L920_9ALTE|nr:hypothetical protein [Alishewanella longhuensis]GHG73676.1 hypothetical protein GCM10010919_26670 [Alishewanella longhuensis]
MKAKKAFQLNLQDKVLWVVADGFWTLATAQAYVKEFRALVTPIVAQPWAVVLDVRAWQVSPAEVFDLLVDNTTWCYQHNLRHVETICADNALVMWQFAKATLADKPAYLVSQLAADEQSAKQALADAGFFVAS